MADAIHADWHMPHAGCHSRTCSFAWVAIWPRACAPPVQAGDGCMMNASGHMCRRSDGKVALLHPWQGSRCPTHPLGIGDAECDALDKTSCCVTVTLQRIQP